MPDTADRYGMRNKTDAELEALAIEGAQNFPDRAGAARAELIRRQREHAEKFVNKQLAAATSVKWATILAAIAAVASAIGTIVQVAMALLN